MATQTLSVGANPEIEIENVDGDLVIEGWDQSEIEARGDALHQIRQEGQSVSISCGGDLQLWVPRGASLSLSHVGGGLSLKNLQGTVELSFVAGDARLADLTGDVSISGVMGDLQMHNVSSASVEPAKGGMHTDLSERIRRKLEEAAQRAQLKAERAARQAERKIKQVERAARHARHAGPPAGPGGEMDRWKWNFAQSSASIPPPDPVSDEERMAILKMLEEKKITSEEAEKLLAALEGGA